LLQVTVELASDGKDFAAALAKMQLAEMGEVKMVQIAQQSKPNPQASVTAKSVNSASVRTGELSTCFDSFPLCSSTL